MRKLPALGLTAAAFLACSGAAAAPKSHTMDVPLPDGSVAHIEYVGEVAPKVTIAPRPLAAAASPWGMPVPGFAGFDRMIEDMNRRTREIVARAQQMARQPLGTPAMNVAAYGNGPAGATSTTVVSVSNGGATCTRTTQVVSEGPGKAPKVTTNLSGQCGPEGPAATVAPAGPLSRT